MDTEIKLGLLKLYLPDGDRKSFLIQGDLRPLFNLEWQYDAANQLRKTITELNLKPFPRISHAEPYTSIQCKNPHDIIGILEVLLNNNSQTISKETLENTIDIIRTWKAPKRQSWKVGDVFFIKLMDSSFAFGQVIGGHPTVSLFNIKKAEEFVSIGELKSSKTVTILHLTPDRLNNNKWNILINCPILAEADSGPTGPNNFQIGHTSFTSSVLQSICDFYWFKICKWENEDDIKKLLMIP